MIEIYQVGGAVRDQLLGIKPADTDYVVVGATKTYMLQQGFLEVGHDFPVYLHPITHEEYALARLERKSGTGHKAFTFETNELVSLIDDLKRRDITINAMALDKNNNLIDPFGGKKDLVNKIIRHVSANFSEDPLRILRVARFSAKFNFSVAKETLFLMQNMVKNGALLELSTERINNEIAKAVLTTHIINFFTILDNINALAQVLPELAKILTDKNFKTEFAIILTQFEEYNLNLSERFAVLGFYMTNANYFTKKAKRLTTLLLKLTNNIQRLDLLSKEEILNIITRLDPSRRYEDYISIKKLLTLIATTRKDKKFIHNIAKLDTIIMQLNNVNYATLKNHADFINEIKKCKLTIIEKNLINPENQVKTKLQSLGLHS